MIMPWSHREIHISVREIHIPNDRPIVGSEKARERRHAEAGSICSSEALPRIAMTMGTRFTFGWDVRSGYKIVLPDRGEIGLQTKTSGLVNFAGT